MTRRRILLDTHILLWALIEPEKLVAQARHLIEDGVNEIYVSPAAAWEIEIKCRLGKLEAPDDLESQCRAARFIELPIRIAHVAELRRLPLHHADPFDRILIAQARAEQLQLMSRDRKMAAYEVRLLGG